MSYFALGHVQMLLLLLTLSLPLFLPSSLPPFFRNFELHAIFWALYRAHPAIARAGPAAAATAAAATAAAATAATSPAVGAEEEEGKDLPSSLEEGPGSCSSSSNSSSSSNINGAVKAAAQVLGGHHQLNYPCNSVSRDVVVFMEARKPVLCNNQKKIFTLRGNLHHDTSLFQGRAWLQIPGGKTWECCKYVTEKGGGGGGQGERGEGRNVFVVWGGVHVLLVLVILTTTLSLTHHSLERCLSTPLEGCFSSTFSLIHHSLERCLSTSYPQARGS